MAEWDGNESSCSCDCGFDIPKGGHLDKLTLGDITGIANLIYPVGSIYMSLDPTDPSTLFGGTWERIEDCFLLAAGSLHDAGEEGGSESYELDIANHTHTITTYNDVKFVSGAVTSGSYDIPITGTTKGAGSVNETIPTMPPYITVYVWKRIADTYPAVLLDDSGDTVTDANTRSVMVATPTGEAYQSKYTGEEIDAGLDAAYAAASKEYVDDAIEAIELTPGADGANGASAYEIAVQNGFEGNETEWLDSLRGEPGVAGEKGDKGDTGAKGTDGYTPKRGTDYWTAADIEEIKSYVDDAILGGAW